MQANAHKISYSFGLLSF